MKQTTIKDIAERCGVSAATVSYVLNDKKQQSISQAVKERVIACATELGYVANNAAKVLRKLQSNCIAVAMEKDIGTRRFNLVLQGIRDELDKHNYNIMLCSASVKQELPAYPDYIVQALERRVDGVIYIGKDNVGPGKEATKLVTDQQIPFVAYDCGLGEEAPFSTLELDYEKCSFEMVGRLFSMGIRKILYIRPEIQNYQEKLREQGVRRGTELYPGMSLRILEAPLNSGNLYQPNMGFNQTEDIYIFRQLYSYMVEHLATALHGFSSDDCVLLSWGSFINPVYEGLRTNRQEVRLATLSDVFISPALQVNILTCRFLGYDIGRECALLLLESLKQPKSVNHMKLTMPISWFEHF